VLRVLLRLPIAFGISAVLVVASAVVGTSDAFGGSVMARVASAILIAAAIFYAGSAVSHRSTRD
jgi:hypothetical protein